MIQDIVWQANSLLHQVGPALCCCTEEGLPSGAEGGVAGFHSPYETDL